MPIWRFLGLVPKWFNGEKWPTADTQESQMFHLDELNI
jgi:hypothetical protein